MSREKDSKPPLCSGYIHHGTPCAFKYWRISYIATFILSQLLPYPPKLNRAYRRRLLEAQMRLHATHALFTAKRPHSERGGYHNNELSLRKLPLTCCRADIAHNWTHLFSSERYHLDWVAALYSPPHCFWNLSYAVNKHGRRLPGQKRMEAPVAMWPLWIKQSYSEGFVSITTATSIQALNSSLHALNSVGACILRKQC